MKVLVIICFSLLLSTIHAYSQKSFNEYDMEDKEIMPPTADTLQPIQPPDYFNQSQMKIYKPKMNEMAPMPYAKIDTSTTYPMEIKKYEIVPPKRKKYLEKKPLDK